MAAADQFDGRTNCRALSLILAQLLRAYNIKAVHITCYPYEEPFDDCHVVVSVYSEHLGKWIMLDPTRNMHLKDVEGRILCIDEFREMLISGEKLMAYAGDTMLNEEFHSFFMDYMADNLVRIQRGVNSGYGIDYRNGGGFITLLPEKYMNNEAKNLSPEPDEIFITSKGDFWRI